MKNYVLCMRICAVLLLFAVLSCLFGCSVPRISPQEYVMYDYFDTVITVTGYDSDFFETCAIIEETVEKYHSLCDIYGDGKMKTVNETAWMAPLEVPDELFDLLLEAKRAYGMTNGKCNVAFGAVTSVWHSYRERALDGDCAVPTREELSEAARHVDIDALVLDGEKKTVYFSDPELRVDLGAFAKGYVADVIANRLIELGKTNYAISVGGTVIATGTKNTEEGWRVGVENPVNTSGACVARLEIKDGTALATSGSYQRFYEHEGKRYHHIIDSETLYPENEFLSVTVAAKSAAEADAFSTAVFCMSLDEGRRFAKENGIEVLWVLADGSVTMTDAFPNID